MQRCKAEPDESCFPVPDYSRSNVLSRLLSHGDGFEQFEHAFYPRGLAADQPGEAARPSPSIPAHVFFSRYAPEPTLPPARRAPSAAPRARTWRGNVAGILSVSLWLALATSDVKQASDAAAEPAPASLAHGPQADRFAFAGRAWRHYDLASISASEAARIERAVAPSLNVRESGAPDQVLTRLAVHYAIDTIPARYDGRRPPAGIVVPASLSLGDGGRAFVEPNAGNGERPWSTTMKVHSRAKTGTPPTQREQDRHALAELIQNSGTNTVTNARPEAPQPVAALGGPVETAQSSSAPSAAGTGKVLQAPARLLSGPPADAEPSRAARRGRATPETRHGHRPKDMHPKAMAAASAEPPPRPAPRRERSLAEQLFASPY